MKVAPQPEAGVLDPNAAIRHECTCPFNGEHKMPTRRFVWHISQGCKEKEKFGHQFKTCQYNALHILHEDEMENHLKTCPDQPDKDSIINDSHLRKKMIAAIQKQFNIPKKEEGEQGAPSRSPSPPRSPRHMDKGGRDNRDAPRESSLDRDRNSANKGNLPKDREGDRGSDRRDRDRDRDRGDRGDRGDRDREPKGRMQDELKPPMPGVGGAPGMMDMNNMMAMMMNNPAMMQGGMPGMNPDMAKMMESMKAAGAGGAPGMMNPMMMMQMLMQSMMPGMNPAATMMGGVPNMMAAGGNFPPAGRKAGHDYPDERRRSTSRSYDRRRRRSNSRGDSRGRTNDSRRKDDRGAGRWRDSRSRSRSRSGDRRRGGEHWDDRNYNKGNGGGYDRDRGMDRGRGGGRDDDYDRKRDDRGGGRSGGGYRENYPPSGGDRDRGRDRDYGGGGGRRDGGSSYNGGGGKQDY